MTSICFYVGTDTGCTHTVVCKGLNTASQITYIVVKSLTFGKNGKKIEHKIFDVYKRVA